MRWSTAAVSLLLLTVAFTGCIGDTDPADQVEPTSDGQPDTSVVYPLPETIEGVDPIAAIENGGGAGLVIHGDHAFVSGLGGGFFVVDISDPQAPEKVAHLEELYARDADVMTIDGQPHIALAAGGNGLHIVDVSDPTNPTVTVAEADVGAPVHNLVTLPGTSLIYNSRSLGNAVEPGIDIVDASDPANPEVTAVWTFPKVAGGKPVVTTGCHDITAYTDVDRAYCAGVTQTYIMDISDPMSPEIISTIENPAVTIDHWVLPSQDHETLIIGDEFLGVLAPVPACGPRQDTPVHPANQPTGGLWFYDISDPATPVPQGFLSAPLHDEVEVCTSHFGDLIGDRPLLAVGWYNAGVLLVDFSDPTNPHLVDQWGQGQTNVWDVRYHNGHLFTGDIGHGMDVLELIGG